MKALLAALLLLAPAAQAQMYKCVDERGRTQYADKPCPGGRSGEVDIRGQQPISGKLNERKEDFGGEDRDFKRRQIQRDRQSEADAARLEQLRRRCAAMRNQLDLLTRYNTISRENEKGERVYMDDATRNARIAQLRAEIAKCPG